MAIKEIVSDNKTIAVLFPASVVQTRGNLMWLDTATPKKASLQTDTGSEAGNQAAFSPLFLGVCGEDRLAADATTLTGVVITDGIFDMTCSSQAWQHGDLIGIARDSSNTVNYDQQVTKVAHPALAIGVCVKSSGGTSVTTVRGRLTSKVNSSLLAAGPLLFDGQKVETAASLADSDVTLTVASKLIQVGVPTGARKVILPDPTLSKGLAFLVVNNSAGANALNIRNNADDTTIQAVAQNKRALAFCDGTTWFVLYGA